MRALYASGGKLPRIVFSPFWLVLFLAYYLPLEDFLLKWTGTGTVPAVLGQAGEVAIYITFLMILMSPTPGKRLKSTPLDWLVISFLFVAILAIFVNQADLFNALKTLKSFLRYIVLFYVLVSLDLSERQHRLLLNSIILTAIFQCFLAALQFVGGPEVIKFFMPLEAESTSASDLAAFHDTSRIGAAVGTMGKTASLGYFLVIAIIVTAIIGYSGSKRIFLSKYSLFIGLFLLGIFLTYKRAPLALGAAFFSVILMRLNPSRLINYISIGGLFAGLFLLYLAENPAGVSGKVHAKETESSPVEVLVQLLDPEYWTRVQENSRGWVIQEVGSSILVSGNILGYSSDTDLAKAKLVENDPSLSRLMAYGPVEDVYWIVIVMYYGYVGFALIAMIFFQLFRVAGIVYRNTTGYKSYSALSLYYVILLIIPACLLERLFEIRVFSYYLWLLAGLTMSVYIRMGRQQANPMSLNQPS